MTGIMPRRFTARQRIRRATDFAAVRNRGIKINGGAFFLQAIVIASQPGDTPLRRVGVIASRRIGGAVVRNRAKRRFRELFRTHQDMLPRRCDIVIVVRRDFFRFSPEQLQARFLKACEHIGRSPVVSK